MSARIMAAFKRLFQHKHSLPHVRHGVHVGFLDGRFLTFGVWMVQCRTCGKQVYVIPFSGGKKKVFDTRPRGLYQRTEGATP